MRQEVQVYVTIKLKSLSQRFEESDEGDRQMGFGVVHCCLKKNLNAPRPSEHPPVRGKKCQNVQVGSIAENTKPLHGI